MNTKNMVTIKNKTFINKYVIFLFYVIAISLTIWGSFKDLQISRYVSNGDSFFGLFFAIVGEFPSYSIIPISGIIFYKISSNKQDNSRIFCTFLSTIILLYGWYFFATKSFMPYQISLLPKFTNHMYSIAIIFALIMTFLSIALTYYLSYDACKKLEKWAFFILLILGTSYLIISPLKYFWGRIRMRDMIAQGGNFNLFVPWYSPQGNTGYSSFPSGHTSSASSLFMILPAIYILTKKKENLRKNILIGNIICFSFLFLTAFSRIIYNAHFLTDVVFGGTITFTIYLIYSSIFFYNLDNKTTKISKKNKA